MNVHCIIVAMAVTIATGMTLNREKRQNYDALLQNKAFVESQINCVLRRGQCDRIGNRIKILVPEVVKTKECLSCTEDEKGNVQKVADHVEHNYPKEWNEIREQYSEDDSDEDSHNDDNNNSYNNDNNNGNVKNSSDNNNNNNNNDDEVENEETNDNTEPANETETGSGAGRALTDEDPADEHSQHTSSAADGDDDTHVPRSPASDAKKHLDTAASTATEKTSQTTTQPHENKESVEQTLKTEEIPTATE